MDIPFCVVGYSNHLIPLIDMYITLGFKCCIMVVNGKAVDYPPTVISVSLVSEEQCKETISAAQTGPAETEYKGIKHTIMGYRMVNVTPNCNLGCVRQDIVCN